MIPPVGWDVYENLITILHMTSIAITVCMCGGMSLLSLDCDESHDLALKHVQYHPCRKWMGSLITAQPGYTVQALPDMRFELILQGERLKVPAPYSVFSDPVLVRGFDTLL